MSDSACSKSAVVTGVSSGIGRAIAKSLVGAGWRVFGSVRKDADIGPAREALGAAFVPLLFDVTDDGAIARAAKDVRAALAGRTLAGLVNNAGIGVGGPLAYVPLADFARQIDVNVFGPIRVTQAFLPLLGADRRLEGPPGRIVNMSSVAGKIAAPFTGPYAMSKHALEAFSDALRRELLVHGIDVVIVGPGAVRTPIWGKEEEFGVVKYLDTEYAEILKRLEAAMKTVGEEGIEAEAVGDLVLNILVKPKPKTRYAILRSRFMRWTLPNLLPARMLDRAIAKRFGITPRR